MLHSTKENPGCCLQVGRQECIVLAKGRPAEPTHLAPINFAVDSVAYPQSPLKCKRQGQLENESLSL